MSKIVEYILSLKSNQFEQGIASADRSTHALDTSFNNLKSTALGLVSAFAGYEFIRSSVDAFNESAQASAQLDASLKSTANAARLNRDALDAQAESLMKMSLYDDDAITGAQALLATFTRVKDTIFMDAIPAIVDMSAKMGTDLQSSVIQVGKALNDPINGLTALKRVGVTFNETQQATIKNLVETNQLAQAQAMILKELQTEFGGSAQAASEAGTGGLTVLKHEFQNVQEEIGALVVTLVNDFKPEMKALINVFSSSVKFISAHKDQIKALVVGYGSYRAALAILVPLIEGYTANTIAATAATEGMALASTAALGPIGLLAAGIGAIGYALYNTVNEAEAAKEAIDKLRSGQENETAAILDKEIDAARKKGESEEGLTKKIADEYAKRKALESNALVQKLDSLQKIKNEESWMLNSFFASPNNPTGSSIDEEIRKVRDELNKNDAAMSAAGRWVNSYKKSGKALNTVAAPPTDAKASQLVTSRPVGSKNVTINVHINDLVKDMRISVNNFKQDAYKIKDGIIQALTGAINDAQIVAEQ